jgi:hypothetical protein
VKWAANQLRRLHGDLRPRSSNTGRDASPQQRKVQSQLTSAAALE